MTWLLTLLFIGPDGSATYQAGLMVSREACQTAGLAMAQVIEEEAPDLRVGWRCDRTEVL